MEAFERALSKEKRMAYGRDFTVEVFKPKFKSKSKIKLITKICVVEGKIVTKQEKF